MTAGDAKGKGRTMTEARCQGVNTNGLNRRPCRGKRGLAVYDEWLDRGAVLVRVRLCAKCAGGLGIMRQSAEKLCKEVK